LATSVKVNKLLSLYYSRTAYIRSQLRKWFLFSFVIGILVGLAVAGVDNIIYSELWSYMHGFTSNYFLAFALPFTGIMAAALIVHRFASNPNIHSTEEVIRAYHEDNGQINLASFPAKVAASILTIGFGGSAGMEGPSIYIGASAAAWSKQIFRRFGFEDADLRWMVLAGAAAGISAIFKAPLTGIVFSLEVPYKDDFAHDALIPSLIASVTSYMVFVSVAGVGPLFKAPKLYAINYQDLLLSIVLGLICGLSARLFVMFFHWFGRFIRNKSANFMQNVMSGSVVMGLVGVTSIMLFNAPYALGTGYEAINDILAGKMLAWQLIVLFLLKVLGTSATMAAGGVGGIFIPMIVMGTAVGGAFSRLISADNSLYPIIGMAAFLGAGYNTPLAAVTFIAETTGSPGFIIPGLIAAVSYTISGRRSISIHQRYHRQTIVHKILRRKVKDVMTQDVVLVPSNITIEQFVNDYLLIYRHKSFPVIERGNLYGMIAICDIRCVPTKDWSNTLVRDVAYKDTVVMYPDQALSEASAIMHEFDIDRLPVVDPKDPKKVVGIIASTDIIRLEEVSKFIQ